MLGGFPWSMPKIGSKILGKWYGGDTGVIYAPQGDGIPFGEMRSASGEEISLKSAHIRGVVDGLLFSSHITQNYRNETGGNLEIIYTFPIAWGTALLGLKGKIGNKCLEGTVVEKKQAIEEYDKAVKAGDAAIMVQESSAGLYTVRLGNIEPNEEVEIAIHCAQLLNFEQDRARLCIPTVIGERYGDSHGPGGLAADESAVIDNSADYPLGLEITIYGDLAKGEIGSPTHPVLISPENGKVKITLCEGARLDRDFVLLMKGCGMPSHASCIQDGENWLAVASYAPHFRDEEKPPLCLKTLIDCSGSMHGESIAQANAGLAKIVDELQEGDFFSFSRFGSTVNHLTSGLINVRQGSKCEIKQKIADTRANMGGTEMANALSEVLAISRPKDGPAASAILLITDGDVWDLDKIEKIALESGQRIHVIGVGSAPAEGPLAKLAKASGGTCEFVTPNENMAETIVRAFRRMRASAASEISMDWRQRPVWTSPVPVNIYSGETAHFFALLPQQPSEPPVLSWTAAGERFSETCAVIEENSDEDLRRLGGMMQMQSADSKKEKLGLALRYQLVGPETNLILIHEREKKSTGKIRVQHVPQMQAHGHGNVAFASVCSFTAMNFVDNIASEMFCSAPARPDRSRRVKISAPKTTRSASRAMPNHKDLDASLKGKIDASAITAKALAAWQNTPNATPVDVMNAIKGSPEFDMLILALNEIGEKLIIPLKKVINAFFFWLLNKQGESASGLGASELDKVEKEALFELFDRYLSC